MLALGGGLVGVLAFPRFGYWPLAIVSVAVLSVAVDGRRARTAAWLGYLYGAAFMLPLVHWTGVFVGPVPWLLLGLADAVFFALLGAVLPALSRLPVAPFWVGAAWVLQEALRDRFPFGGFPWGRLAFSQADSPLRWFAAVGGEPFLSFVVALAGGALALSVLAVVRVGAGETLRPRAAVGLVVAVLVPVLGLVLAWPLAPGADRAGRTLRIAAIQGGLPDLGLEYESRAEQVLDNHVRQTLKLAAEVKAGTVARPDLVVWPEDSDDDDPFTNPTAYAKITRAVRAVGVPVLIGTILPGRAPHTRRNVGILWSPTTGPGAEYVKRHPVPFGEYIPLRGLAEKVSSDADLVEDMVAGHGNGLLRGAAVPLGDVICFEVAYDSLVHSSVAAGAQLLVVQTNNATFGRTPETYQQLAMSQLRAVETGRTVVQVATTGKSAVIGPDGVIRQESGALFTHDILSADVPVRTVLTLADRVGPWPEYVLAALAVLAAFTVVAHDRSSRRRRSPSTPPQVAPARTEMAGT
ncbi:MAG: apolipoprotein N-acyltransferase [Jatrophihabitans endophyticus]|nr:apolipoprotein N-acyltransferase [Jatrophihabitans endophyticus]